jgi:hypothetical protein
MPTEATTVDMLAPPGGFIRYLIRLLMLLDAVDDV